jgi:hypothetical protein
MRRLLLIPLIAALTATAAAGAAAWATSGGGVGYARGKSFAPAAAPTATVTLRQNNARVALSWADAGFVGGGGVNGFVVSRYASTGQKQTLSGPCNGVVAGTSCNENNVPSGSWQYTITPAVGNWLGSESPKSTIVTVP